MKDEYKAIDIAKYFINELHPEPLKLQKLLYFAQGFSYAFYDKELFNDDFEAWVHGPVIPSIYHEYKSYEYNPIDLNYNLKEFNKDVIDLLEYVKKNYAKYDGKYLEEITHREEPWLLSRTGLDPDERSDKTISKSNIAAYFTSYVLQPSDEEWD